MEPVRMDEILSLAAYEEVRPHFRDRVIAEKKQRRIALGGNMSVVFENHDTVLLQIQEMLRTERITATPAIEHEIETYNQLIPGESELSATIFIEYAERDERERMLVQLAGIEDKFYLRVDGRSFPVYNETRVLDPGRTTAVQYVKFPLDMNAVAHVVARTATLVLGVKHPAYEAETQCSAATVAQLARDFA